MKEDGKDGLFGCGALLVIVLLVVACSGIVSYSNEQEMVGIVESTYIKRVDEYDRFYVVVKGDRGELHVFENKDSPWRGKWDSATMHARLRTGVRAKFRTVGYRSPFWSMFPNVIRAEILED